MVSHSAAAQTSSCLIRNGLRGWPVWLVCKRRSVKGEVFSFTATKTTHNFWCSKLPIDICISSSIKRLCVQCFSWRQHRNGSFWSCKLRTSVLSLHTQGAWTEREGCTNWYRGSRKRHAVWGATGEESEYVVFYPGVWGKWLESEPDDSKLPPSSFGGFSS